MAAKSISVLSKNAGPEADRAWRKPKGICRKTLKAFVPERGGALRTDAPYPPPLSALQPSKILARREDFAAAGPPAED